MNSATTFLGRQNNNIMKSETTLVRADKTSNFYEMDTASYNDLLNENIIKICKKVIQGTTNSIELEAKAVAKKLNLDDRISIIARREASITLKIKSLTSLTTPYVAF